MKEDWKQERKSRGERKRKRRRWSRKEKERGISCYHIWHAIASLIPVPPLFLFSIRMEENRDSNTYHVRGTWRGVTLITREGHGGGGVQLQMKCTLRERVLASNGAPDNGVTSLYVLLVSTRCHLRDKCSQAFHHSSAKRITGETVMLSRTFSPGRETNISITLW